MIILTIASNAWHRHIDRPAPALSDIRGPSSLCHYADEVRLVQADGRYLTIKDRTGGDEDRYATKVHWDGWALSCGPRAAPPRDESRIKAMYEAIGKWREAKGERTNSADGNPVVKAINTAWEEYVNGVDLPTDPIPTEFEVSRSWSEIGGFLDRWREEFGTKPKEMEAGEPVRVGALVVQGEDLKIYKARGGKFKCAWTPAAPAAIRSCEHFPPVHAHDVKMAPHKRPYPDWFKQTPGCNHPEGEAYIGILRTQWNEIIAAEIRRLQVTERELPSCPVHHEAVIVAHGIGDNPWVKRLWWVCPNYSGPSIMANVREYVPPGAFINHLKVEIAP